METVVQVNDAPPSEVELGGHPPRCLDTNWMLGHFLGKTRAQAVELLARECESVTEDFAHMTAAGLRYYLPAVLDYLRTPGPDGRWFAQGLLCSLRCHVTISGVPPDVLALIRMVAAHCREQGHRLFEDPEDSTLESYFAAIEEGRKRPLDD